MHIYIYIYISLCCTPEALQINCTSILKVYRPYSWKQKNKPYFLDIFAYLQNGFFDLNQNKQKANKYTTPKNLWLGNVM